MNRQVEGGKDMELEAVDACPVCGSTNVLDLDEEHRLRECTSCSFVFDSPRPTSQEIVAFYSQSGQYDDWIEEKEARDRLWVRRLNKLLRHRRSGSLLDVGTGIGQFLHLASPHFERVYGTEVSASAVQLARQLYGIEVFQGELEQVDPGLRVGTITLFHVLEHVPDPRSTMARCWNHLVPGGVVAIAVPNDVKSARQRVKVLLGTLGVPRFARRGRLGLPRIVLDGTMSEIHLSHFSEETLQRLLRETGFRVLESSLDPYSVATGVAGLRDALLRASCRLVQWATRRNFYDAIWMVAEKPFANEPQA